LFVSSDAVAVYIYVSAPASLRYTTTMDGGSADFAGAKICPPIHGRKKALRGGLEALYHL